MNYFVVVSNENKLKDLFKNTRKALRAFTVDVKVPMYSILVDNGIEYFFSADLIRLKGIPADMIVAEDSAFTIEEICTELGVEAEKVTFKVYEDIVDELCAIRASS